MTIRQMRKLKQGGIDMSKVWYKLIGDGIDMMFSNYKAMSLYWTKLPLDKAITCKWEVVEL